jgi:hypothetical protein
MTPAEFIRLQPFDITATEVMRRARAAGVRSFTPGLVYNTRTAEKRRRAEGAMVRPYGGNPVSRTLVGYMVRLKDGSYLGGGSRGGSWVLGFRYLPDEHERKAAHKDAKKHGGVVVRIYRKRGA